MDHWRLAVAIFIKCRLAINIEDCIETRGSGPWSGIGRVKVGRHCILRELRLERVSNADVLWKSGMMIDRHLFPKRENGAIYKVFLLD